MSEYPQTASPSAEVPSPSDFISSPLRNRLVVELDAPVSEVWELMGDLSRFPEYSAGLERVEAQVDGDGRCVEYTCYFKPIEEGSEGIVTREIMKWYEPSRGYLSVEAEPGNTVALTTLDPIPAGTRVTTDMYFDADELDMYKAALDEALADIAENLIGCFGGRVIDRYVET
jgi:hypothetical protein